MAEARSPFVLFDEVKRAREVLVLTYTAGLEFFERFALADARALGALVTVISDATMVRADPMVVRRAGTHYLDARAVCPGGAFHPKVLVIVGDGQARVAVGSGNLTMAGWHANAETWTVLRADEDGGPTTLRDVSAFLRDLDGSSVALSPGAGDALLRTAKYLDELPADTPGPRLLSSLPDPIVSMLPPVAGPVDDLVMYAPFHDARLDGMRALLDHFRPEAWTIFVRSDTEVDGPLLEALARERRGRIAWVSRETSIEAKVVADERYWHGKLVQWRTGDETWALTGSPNLSTPALLRSVSEGGNCEIAVLGRTHHDLTPQEGDVPPGGVSSLRRSPSESEARPAALLLAAIASKGNVTLLLHTELRAAGVVQRYDVGEDQWRTTASIGAGHDRYELDISQAPIGQALRLLLDGDAASNSVFVADLERVRQPQRKSVGKVRLSPEDVARLGLGNQLLADLDELRPHLLSVGAIVPAADTPALEAGDATDDAGPSARPAAGMTCEEYVAACDPVLGQRMTEFALALPALPGVGAALDDTVGTLDTDDDTDTGDEGDSQSGTSSTLTDELRKRTPDERARYRSFVERLIARAPTYPMVVRTLALRTLLHSIAARFWADDRWPDLLADALRALGASGDQPRPEELRAAASLAAVGLALLRADVTRISRRDEDTMRYQSAGRAIRNLLVEVDASTVEMLATELLGRHSAAGGALAAERAIEETLHPPRGVQRAIRILSEEYGESATLDADGAIVLDAELAPFPEPMLNLVLGLTEDRGPVFVRGTTADGKRVLAGWCSPLLAVEKVGRAGPFGRAWVLAPGQTPGTLDRFELPPADVSWSVKEPRPADVEELLGLVTAGSC